MEKQNIKYCFVAILIFYLVLSSFYLSSFQFQYPIRFPHHDQQAYFFVTDTPTLGHTFSFSMDFYFVSSTLKLFAISLWILFSFSFYHYVIDERSNIFDLFTQRFHGSTYRNRKNLSYYDVFKR